MDNLELYNKLREVPKEAQKEITGGRLKGFTDINPMWRIKALTDAFGVCGFGWKYEIVSQELREGANSEIAAFVTINLYVKLGEWSEAIQGVGGSMFVTKETNRLYTSDECFKMALTDALSVACKSLGVGADIYFAKDRTKYDRPTTQDSRQILMINDSKWSAAVDYLRGGGLIAEIEKKYIISTEDRQTLLTEANKK